ncbi:MAG: hypothetical protein ACQESH_09105, partial [Campylobacterota bacterium]
MDHSILIITNTQNQASMKKLQAALDAFDVQILLIKEKYEAINRYKQLHRDYTCIIYDHDMQAGLSILQHILHTSAQKNIIIYSNCNYCSDEKGCTHCMAHFNKKRVHKDQSV